MREIPTNRNVNEKYQVQNVITSVILRQQGCFLKEEIYEQVEAKLKFSSFGKFGKRRKEIDLGKMIDHTIEELFIVNGVVHDRKDENKLKLSLSFPSVTRR